MVKTAKACKSGKVRVRNRCVLSCAAKVEKFAAKCRDGASPKPFKQTQRKIKNLRALTKRKPIPVKALPLPRLLFKDEPVKTPMPMPMPMPMTKSMPMPMPTNNNLGRNRVNLLLQKADAGILNMKNKNAMEKQRRIKGFDDMAKLNADVYQVLSTKPNLSLPGSNKKGKRSTKMFRSLSLGKNKRAFSLGSPVKRFVSPKKLDLPQYSLSSLSASPAASPRAASAAASSVSPAASPAAAKPRAAASLRASPPVLRKSKNIRCSTLKTYANCNKNRSICNWNAKKAKCMPK